jgi:hypothetical protein
MTMRRGHRTSDVAERVAGATRFPNVHYAFLRAPRRVEYFRPQPTMGSQCQLSRAEALSMRCR